MPDVVPFEKGGDMLDMDRLFELLDEAKYGMKCKCSTTTKAYLRLAEIEAFRLAGDAEDKEEERKVRAAAVYISGLVNKLTWNEKTFTAARTAIDFWYGFEDGLHERTQRERVSTAFRRGYRFGRDGS